MAVTCRWITIDGPAGTGKSTIAALLADRLAAAGHNVHRTQQPSRTEFGQYVRHAIKTMGGVPLACLITADRYQHVHHEITPALADGKTVVCDRYVPSAALDILRGVPADQAWAMHAALPAPTLAVILKADENVITKRITARGPHSRWQTHTGNTGREVLAYQAATEYLRRIGWPLLTIDTTTAEPAVIATTIAQRFLNC